MAVETYSGVTVTRRSQNNYRVTYQGVDALVDIGSGATAFRPRLVFNRWTECSLILDLPQAVLGSLGNAVLSGKQVTWNSAGFTFSLIPTAPKLSFNDLGGLDFSLTFKSRPVFNSLSFAYNSTLIIALLQPSLTQEWTIGQEVQVGKFITSVTDTDAYFGLIGPKGQSRFHRPEHVVNSIAFYHATRGNLHLGADADKYRCGKIGHLYRMKVADSGGHSSYGDWSISGSNVVLSFDPAFLSTAIYPVIVTPLGDTFGYTTLGASYRANGDNTTEAGLYATAAAPTVTEITVGMKGNANGSTGTRVAIYTAAKGKVWGDAEEVSVTLAANVAEWDSYAVPSQALSATTSYYLAFASGWSSYPAQGGMLYDSSGTGGYGGYDWWDSAWPSTLTLTGDTNKYSIYATYTAAGGLSVPISTYYMLRGIR